MNGFDFLTNLPVLVFAFIFFIVFIIFIRGGVILLMARDEEREEKGGRILLGSLYSFLTILIIALVFFSVSYLLRRGETLQPLPATGELPSSLAVNFPPPPQFINVEGYYFSGPWLLEKNEFIEVPVLYVILCKKNEGYDIIYIGQTEENEQLLRHEQYKCWVENCEQGSKNLYLGTFLLPLEKYSPEEKKEIEEKLEERINPPCPVVESNI